MAQPILIAVGGSGQNVLSAYLRLATMAGFTPAPFYVVDSDTKGPQFQGLMQLRSQVPQVLGGAMRQRWQVSPFPLARSDRRTFGELFPSTGKESQEVFECLFSEEEERTPIREGMYGRPAIGAACMQLKLLQEDDDLRELKQILQGGEKQVVLVGSCFGGTGSGGIPILAQEFHRLNEASGYKLHVQAVVFLPWFRLELPRGDMRGEDKRLHLQLDESFQPNAAASIRYFNNAMRQYVETILFLGLTDSSAVTRISGEAQQGEAPHPLNLLAAVLAQGLLTGELSAPRGVAGYWYEPALGLDPARLEVPRGENGKPSPLNLVRTVRRAALQVQWMGILRVFFASFPRIPELYRPAFFESAITRLRDLGTQESEILAQISAFFAQRQAALSDALQWFDQVQKQDERLLPLDASDKRVQSPEYEERCRDPLAYLAHTARGLGGRFESNHFRRPADFAARLGELVLNDLYHDFNL
jgi:hypothetical protein